MRSRTNSRSIVADESSDLLADFLFSLVLLMMLMMGYGYEMTTTQTDSEAAYEIVLDTDGAMTVDGQQTDLDRFIQQHDVDGQAVMIRYPGELRAGDLLEYRQALARAGANPRQKITSN